MQIVQSIADYSDIEGFVYTLQQILSFVVTEMIYCQNIVDICTPPFRSDKNLSILSLIDRVDIADICPTPHSETMDNFFSMKRLLATYGLAGCS